MKQRGVEVTGRISRRVFGHLESGRKLRTESIDEIPTQY